MIRVTVVLALNKYDSYTPKAIDSILCQSYTNFEFIIVANSCSDDDYELIRQCCLLDERIILYRNKISQLPFSLNFALNEAKGEYIARMDADDISLPNRLLRQVEFLDEHKDISVVGSSYYLIDEDDKCYSLIQANTSPVSIYNKFPLGTLLCHPSVMMRRLDVLSVGGYCYGFFAEDYDLWLRLIAKNKYCISNIDEPLIQYRVHTNQATGTTNSTRNISYNYGLMIINFIQTKRIKFLLGLLWQAPCFIRIKRFIKERVIL
ncbi:glycosyltransferase [Aeromonas veronii]|uniref:glycosyltransferase n=1 Tax=Aeromonas veronii TaxID=654 RepID=UPI00226CD249|nr:glycosyltransferase [Aeromonas veronii]MCX9132803.1 glycosyltransferase [Aeromonas veronii]